jgi:hypothetical protein
MNIFAQMKCMEEKNLYGRDASQKSITGDACCFLTIR